MLKDIDDIDEVEVIPKADDKSLKSGFKKFTQIFTGSSSRQDSRSSSSLSAPASLPHVLGPHASAVQCFRRNLGLKKPMIFSLLFCDVIMWLRIDDPRQDRSIARNSLVPSISLSLLSLWDGC